MSNTCNVKGLEESEMQLATTARVCCRGLRKQQLRSAEKHQKSKEVK